MKSQTSFHINGFWFHVNWNAKGTIGIDQHGSTWFNKLSPISECGGFKGTPPVIKPPSNKDLFMY